MSGYPLPFPIGTFVNCDDKLPIDLSARVSQPSSIPSPQPSGIPPTQPSAPKDKHPVSQTESSLTMKDEHAQSTVPSRLTKTEVDGKKFFVCQLCDARLTSLVSLRQHESGKRHQTALAVGKRKQTSIAMSPASNYGEDGVSSSNSRHSPLQFPLKDCTNTLDLLSIEPAYPTEHNPTKHLMPPSRLKDRVLDGSKVPDSDAADTHSKRRRRANELFGYADENNLSDEKEQKHTTVSMPPSTTELGVRDVLRRVCLTQMMSLLSNQVGSRLSITDATNEQVLLQTLHSLCNEVLANPTSDNSCEETLMESHFLSPNQLTGNFLLLSWCQQLAMLDR